MLLQASTQLIATELRDYPEWHHGRSDYGLWYIEIDQPELIRYLDQVRTPFSNLLIPSNQRQYHITLFVCGFLTADVKKYDDDFQIAQLNRQIDLVKQLQLKPFELEITQIDSFSSALFLHIKDKDHVLAQIRQQFAQLSGEIAALEYCPHITLGLYREAWLSDIVLERIQQHSIKTINIEVKKLTFGYYKAQILQGFLYPYQQIELG
ncbi:MULTISPECIES: 2'-5' RNA ligase family protein [unclassified Acinetobacter]|uniref:2'-5' RNA ligase family protein n=1 Tax=unclassified Acinetobacter TaxID=196816 RepID=UPI0022AC6A60|nr:MULTISPECIES: 2'-5' RNA ligase family protein [unclassified Acinetobacter]WAU74972.1 2'-5' RNA ligase family protein [Acinetobacter sp. TR11]WAU75232.1 2'-5' RNA ligase family protein [Acinetobacter sp. TR3]